MNSWSLGSMVEVIRVAASESVRATARRLTPMTVSAKKLGFDASHTHYIGLRSYCDESIDMLADGHKYLASHVTTLLGSRSLVFDVYSCRTFLDEQLCELHDSR